MEGKGNGTRENLLKIFSFRVGHCSEEISVELDPRWGFDDGKGGRIQVRERA